MATPPEMKPKSFWERPEGTTGMLVGAGLLVAGGLVLYRILPFIITLLQNALTAAALFAALAAVVYVASDKRFRTLLSYGYKSLMRWITGWFIEIDPIGILKSYVDDLKKSLEQMRSQIDNLRGQMRSLQETIKSNEQQKQQALQIAAKAKEAQKANIVVLKARKAGRLEDSNLTLQALYTKMEVLYRVLLKMYEASEFMLEDIEDEVQVKTRERAAIQASHSAFRSAMKILRGDPDSRAIFDQTMEYLAEDYGKKLGEIENFLEMSRGFLDSVDLQNGIYEERAFSMLEAWEKQSDSLLLGDQKQQMIAIANNPTEVLSLEAPPPQEALGTKKREREAVPIEARRENASYDALFKDDSQNPKR